LGVDLGTTFSAAAVAHGTHAEMFSLASNLTAIPSVVFRTEDGRYLTGLNALEQGRQHPSRLGREFKRRVGDPEPLVLGGVEVTPEFLMGELLRSIVDEVRKIEGDYPDHISVCHPANWGPFKQELLIDAIGALGIGLASLVAEPVAAATYYGVAERLSPGDIVAVYDLGGGTFDATVLEHTGEGFEIRGDPDGMDRFGGIDVDEAVRDHVLASIGDRAEHLLGDDERSRRRADDFRAACTAAKERLSYETVTEITVDLPEYDIVKVAMTRDELEARIRPSIARTIETLRDTLRVANVEEDQITKVLLVGGSSRMPIVAEMVAAHLQRPVAVDAHPKNATPLGAALVPLASVFDEWVTATTASEDADSNGSHPDDAVPVRLEGMRDLVPIGSSGFSTVYRAYDEVLGREVAVKVLHMAGEQSRRRFEREQLIAARIGRHPRIVSTLDYGETEAGQPCLEMEYYRQGSLTDWLEGSRRLSLKDALTVGVEIADALNAAHHADVVHRDINPGTILVDDDGHFALAGFGIAALRRDPGAALTTDALTPHHAPPEVLRSGRPGPTADIYSLGSTLYTLIAGHSAFGGSENEVPYSLMVRIMDARIPPIEGVVVPPSLLAALQRAMAKNAADRYANAYEFAVALQAVQAELGFAQTEIFSAPVRGAKPTREAPRPVSAPPQVLLPARSSAAHSRVIPAKWRRVAVAAVAVLAVSGGVAGAVVVGRSDSPAAPPITTTAPTIPSTLPPTTAAPATTQEPTTTTKPKTTTTKPRTTTTVRATPPATPRQATPTTQRVTATTQPAGPTTEPCPPGTHHPPGSNSICVPD
jgi:molecular chaperone DnaK (HSP70)